MAGGPNTHMLLSVVCVPHFVLAYVPTPLFVKPD